MKYFIIVLSFVFISGTVIYQAVRHDTTMTGEGITGSELKVDTTIISTKYYGTTLRSDNISKATSQPNEGKSNSTVADQDYTSIYTIPANYLTTGKTLRVSILFEAVAGTSTVTVTQYLKLGSTKIATSASPQNLTNGTTLSLLATYTITGTEAAGASTSVLCGANGTIVASGGAGVNGTNQPVTGIATNGSLDIVPGITYSGTGTTETVTILWVAVEQVN